GTAMLEALGHDDLDAMLGAGDGIADGLELGHQRALRRDVRAALCQVEGELDRREDRIMHVRHDEREDVEDRTWLRVLAGENAEQSLPLLRGCSLVHDRLDLAVA